MYSCFKVKGMIAYSNEIDCYDTIYNINSNATPTNDTDYGYHINAVELV